MTAGIPGTGVSYEARLGAGRRVLPGGRRAARVAAGRSDRRGRALAGINRNAARRRNRDRHPSAHPDEVLAAVERFAPPVARPA
jgi:hypothetical protein